MAFSTRAAVASTPGWSLPDNVSWQSTSGAPVMTTWVMRALAGAAAGTRGSQSSTTVSIIE